MNLSDIYITEELVRRRTRPADYLGEKNALQDLAARMVDEPAAVLPRFVELAMKMTGGVSAGLSLLEATPAPAVFRWRYLQGRLAAFENATTPRDFSPCGVTLDQNAPVLATRPERYYDWIAATGVDIPEVLLVPLHMHGKEPMGTLWIVAASEGQLNREHARIAAELASFVGIALRMLSTEQRLQSALEQQETLTREMSHRVKNLFAISEGLVRLTTRAASTKEQLAEMLVGRFHALAGAHALVRRNFAADGSSPQVSDLAELLRVIVEPHERAVGGASRFTISGPAVLCGEHALHGLALVFHELVTNAAKYGALAADAGKVVIEWAEEAGQLVCNWRERGGPTIDAAPSMAGFGSKLLRDTIEQQFRGTLQHSWNADGLVVAIRIPAESVSR
ncbi:MAG TPA: HWE histidine kinase domain-containing protein [Steroidobacteraceae bacterium]|nr:HWE histidine kinase domain-containing protein [Steroidobacteraceae bacterium]